MMHDREFSVGRLQHVALRLAVHNEQNPENVVQSRKRSTIPKTEQIPKTENIPKTEHDHNNLIKSRKLSHFPKIWKNLEERAKSP